MHQVSSSTPTPPKKSPAAVIAAALQSVIAVGVVMATLFTMWSPNNLFSNQMLDQMIQAWQQEEPAEMALYPTPTALPPLRIGIVAGHMNNDAGAVCSDGLKEVDINTNIASLVQGKLAARGYQVDLLDEFDERLYGYQAIALVSIHNDSCDDIGPDATGFKVAAAKSSAYPEKAARLENCLINRYHEATGMPFHEHTITPDMTDYHSFREIHSETTAAIIETGFMAMDREILTKQPDRVAEGIVGGIICFIENENLSPDEPANDGD